MQKAPSRGELETAVAGHAVVLDPLSCPECRGVQCSALPCSASPTCHCHSSLECAASALEARGEGGGAVREGSCRGEQGQYLQEGGPWDMVGRDADSPGSQRCGGVTQGSGVTLRAEKPQ